MESTCFEAIKERKQISNPTSQNRDTKIPGKTPEKFEDVTIMLATVSAFNLRS